ncbi:PREDICTED: uncharacterized protein LOC108564330, partial [Nicrophorus vespilloides]|uniref:Uncharacterized protein LOC108564330 n=1 Tax=Nicrophorus vespilloides TaxID=110193 RepID=A0ABM1MW73_NICVS
KYGIVPFAPLQYSKSWENFSYAKHTLDEFFEDVTFKIEEVVTMYGFEGYTTNVSVTERLMLTFGKCFVLTAKNHSSNWNKYSGYSVNLFHNNDYRIIDTTIKSVKNMVPGYHVYIHNSNDIVADQETQFDSLMEDIYLEPGSDLGFSLRVSQYSYLPGSRTNCIKNKNYSKSKCKQKCINQYVTEKIGCSTPWMDNPRQPRCNSYEKVKSLMMLTSSTSNEEFEKICKCPTSCYITSYIPYVQSNKELPSEISGLYLYYATNLVTIMDEVIGYDWNLFLADLGGSLGFLLGLSVLGIIGVFEQVFKIIVLRKPKDEVLNNVEKGQEQTPQKKIEIYLNGEPIDDGHDYGYYEKSGNIKY